MKNLLLLTVGQVLGQDGPPPPQLGTESLLKAIKNRNYVILFEENNF